jgi:hypothetical protein
MGRQREGQYKHCVWKANAKTIVTASFCGLQEIRSRFICFTHASECYVGEELCGHNCFFVQGGGGWVGEWCDVQSKLQSLGVNKVCQCGDSRREPLRVRHDVAIDTGRCLPAVVEIHLTWKRRGSDVFRGERWVGRGWGVVWGAAWCSWT